MNKYAKIIKGCVPVALGYEYETQNVLVDVYYTYDRGNGDIYGISIYLRTDNYCKTDIYLIAYDMYEDEILDAIREDVKK